MALPVASSDERRHPAPARRGGGPFAAGFAYNEIPPEKKKVEARSVSHGSRGGGLAASPSNPDSQAAEASVRQLIAAGKSRTALESAKQLHKSQPTLATESLLLDAYAARIQGLIAQGLTQEAKSLADLAGERFPAAKERFERLMFAATVRGGDLASLLAPLNDPHLGAERRAAIEQAVQTRIVDLGELAACPALPPESGLRLAAAALDRAFTQVTSGPVTDEEIALPEVSHRSPLSSWKAAIRAIVCFHRGQDAPCREHLAGIKTGSAAARLIPVMEAMLAGERREGLGPAELALVTACVGNTESFGRCLAELDLAFLDGDDPRSIYGAARTAAQQCQAHAPELLTELRQMIFARASAAGLDRERMSSALAGAARQDAHYYRMCALIWEQMGDPEDIAAACHAWDLFREEAVREGWFAGQGLEVAALYLHMADLLTGLSRMELVMMQGPTAAGRPPRQDRYFLFPDALFERACELDPHPEVFSKWLSWAANDSVSNAEEVARRWNQERPGDVEPLLYLMQRAWDRKAWPTALSFLDQAERADPVHPVVRNARLKLLAAAALRHAERREPSLVEEKLALLAALPQSRLGYRPAFLAAFHHWLAMDRGEDSRATAALGEAEALLGSRLAAVMMASGIAAVSKRLSPVRLPSLRELSAQERKTIPGSLGRVLAIARDFDLAEFRMPGEYIKEAEKQLARARQELDLQQLLTLAELGNSTNHPKLAWAASNAGLELGGTTEAHFMKCRAKAAPERIATRRLALAAAAAAMGREHGEPEVVDEALVILRDSVDGEAFQLTPAQAREVVRQELASPAFPTPSRPGPKYADLIPDNGCQCPECRRRRGEIGDAIPDEAEFERIFRDSAPPGLPPELARMFAQALKESFMAGETPDEALYRLFGGGGKRNKKKRGQR